jgi:acetyl esterase/lipase
MTDTDMATPIVWNGFTRAALDAAYNNSAAIADSAAYVADWTTRSAATLARSDVRRDLRYGPRERNRIDLLPSGVAGAPLVAFIHGGYWQRNTKEIFACMAEGPLAAGIDVALIGYTLAPEVTLTAIVAEIRDAVTFLRREAPKHGMGRAALVVSGWSAGGHLTATTLSLPEIDAGLSISGVFDVEPCRLNYLNDKLGLTAEEAARMSPIRHIDASQKPVTLAYGTAELPELQRQSRDYATAVAASGASATLLPLAGHNHFTILEELARPRGALVAVLLRIVAALPRGRRA